MYDTGGLVTVVGVVPNASDARTLSAEDDDDDGYSEVAMVSRSDVASGGGEYSLCAFLWVAEERRFTRVEVSRGRRVLGAYWLPGLVLISWSSDPEGKEASSYRFYRFSRKVSGGPWVFESQEETRMPLRVVTHMSIWASGAMERWRVLTVSSPPGLPYATSVLDLHGVFAVQGDRLSLSLLESLGDTSYYQPIALLCDLTGDEVPDLWIGEQTGSSVTIFLGPDYWSKFKYGEWYASYSETPSFRAAQCADVLGRKMHEVLACNAKDCLLLASTNLLSRLEMAAMWWPSAPGNVPLSTDLDGDNATEFIVPRNGTSGEVLDFYNNVSCRESACWKDPTDTRSPFGFACSSASGDCANGSLSVGALGAWQPVDGSGGCAIVDRDLAHQFCLSSVGRPLAYRTWCVNDSVLWSCASDDSLAETSCAVRCGLSPDCGVNRECIPGGVYCLGGWCQPCSLSSKWGLCIPVCNATSDKELRSFCSQWTRFEKTGDIAWETRDAHDAFYFTCDGGGTRISCLSVLPRPGPPAGANPACAIPRDDPSSSESSQSSSESARSSSEVPRSASSERQVVASSSPKGSALPWLLVISSVGAALLVVLGGIAFFSMRRGSHSKRFRLLLEPLAPVDEDSPPVRTLDFDDCGVLMKIGAEYRRTVAFEGAVKRRDIIFSGVDTRSFDVSVLWRKDKRSFEVTVVPRCAALLVAEASVVDRSEIFVMRGQSELLPVNVEVLPDLECPGRASSAAVVQPSGYYHVPVSGYEAVQNCEENSYVSFSDIGNPDVVRTIPYMKQGYVETTTLQIGAEPSDGKESAAGSTDVPSLDLSWTTKFNSVLDMPEDNVEQRRAKEMCFLRLSLEFERAARRVVATIVSEVGVEDHLKSIKTYGGASGFAGGTKYVTEGMFLKFAADVHQLYGGDEFAGKAAAHEIHGSNAFLAHVLGSVGPKSAGAPRLGVPLSVVMDFAGFRVIVMSQLPLTSETLVYGSDDGGITVRDCDPIMSSLIAEAAKEINLKPHRTGNSEPRVSLCGPCDIEGHRGSDRRLYLVDTARVFPPESVSHNFNACVLRVSEISSQPKDLSEALSGMPEDLPLPTNGWTPQVLGEIRDERTKRLKFSGGVLCTRRTEDDHEDEAGTTPNVPATVLVGRPVRGTAVLIPPGVSGRQLFRLLRPEMVKSNSVPLSSDAFTKFGFDESAVHNEEVRQATKRMRVDAISELVEELRAHRLVVGNGVDLASEMHRRGINLRYLAVLFQALSAAMDTDPRLRRVVDVVLAEMVARSVKVITKEVMRNGLRSGSSVSAEEAERLAVDAALVHVNLLLWLDPSSRVYWRGIVKVQLQVKYGQYVSVRTRSHWDEIERLSETLSSRLFLIRAIEEQLGVEFVEGVDVARRLMSGKRFELCDVKGLGVIVQGRLDVLTHFGGDASCDWAGWVTHLISRLDVVLDLCGPHSREACICHLQLGLVQAKLGRFEECRESISSAQKAQPEMPALLGSVALFCLSRLWPSSGGQEKLDLLWKCHELLLCDRGWDGKSSNNLAPCHPFEAVVVHELVIELWRSKMHEEAEAMSRRFRELVNSHGFVIPESTIVRAFGTALPLGYSLCTTMSEVSNRSEVNDGPILWGQVPPEAGDQKRADEWEEMATIHEHLANRSLLDSTLIITARSSRFVPRCARSSHHPVTSIVSSIPQDSFCATFTTTAGGAGFHIVPELITIEIRSLVVGSAVTSAGGGVLWEGSSFFAVTSTGSLFAWGANDNGQLGLGIACQQECTVPRPTLCRSVSDVTKVASGGDWTLILTSKGEVLACGNNSRGTLGTGDRETRYAPFPLQSLEGDDCVDIAATARRGLSVSSSGVVSQWGATSSSSQEHLDLLPRAVGGAVGRHKVRRISASERGFCVLCGEQSRLIWAAWGDDQEIVDMEEGRTAIDLVCCRGSIIVLLDDGHCLSIGDNSTGLLATGDFKERPIALARDRRLGSLTHGTMLEGESVVKLSGGGDRGCALAFTDASEALWWGRGRSVPTPLPFTTGFVVHSSCHVVGDSFITCCGVTGSSLSHLCK